MSIAGKLSTAKINNTGIIGVQKSTATGSVKELDGATAEDGGYEHPDAGLASMEVSLDLVVDITTGDLTTIHEGVVISNLQVFANINAANPVRTIPTFLVLQAVYTGEVAGRSTYSVRGKAVGPFTNSNPN